MKINSLYFFLLLAIAFSSNALEAQVPDGSSLQIPPLNILIDSALQSSPLLKAKAIELDVNVQELKNEKKRWMDYVFIEGAANYGLFDQVVISGLTTEGGPGTGLLTKSEQVRYYGGVGVKLPLSSLTNRRNKLKMQRLTLEKGKNEMLQMDRDIQQIVINEYYRLKYLEESMKTFNNTYQTLQMGYLKAKKDFENERIKLADFSLVASMTGKAKDNFDKAKNDFYSQYFRLQSLTGMRFKKNSTNL